MGAEASRRVGLVFRGDRAQWETLRSPTGRLAPVAEALAGVGLTAEAVVFGEEWAPEVRDRLLGLAGALVWVDPVTGSQDRAVLDDILREVAAAGVWVSAHPDVILKMGTKEVLYSTRTLGWGSDTHLYRTPAELAQGLPPRLAGGPRVLKQYRGNGGIGVWKVELAPGASPEPRGLVRVQSARARDATVEELTLGELLERCRKYFDFSSGRGRLIDQPFRPEIVKGITRCYLVKGDVVGYSRQYPAGHAPPGAATEDGPPVPADRVFGLPGAKTMYGPDEPQFQSLRRSMEIDWVPEMRRLLGIDLASLPVLWDADFLFGPPTGSGDPHYVLSEINVSAVAPFPGQALPKLAHAVASSLEDVRAGT